MSIIEPGTEAWVRIRLGKVTASRVYDVIGVRKDGKPYKARRDYLIELIAERLTGMSADAYKFQSEAMIWGLETEPAAIAAYERFRGFGVKPVGFVDHPKIPMSGGTPDGNAWPGLIQVKCPESRTHVATLIERTIPDDYLAQMHWEMACVPTAEWCDYVSYDPRLPADYRLAVMRIKRNGAIIADMEDRVRDFLNELDREMAAMTGGELLIRRPEPLPPKPARETHLASEDIAGRLTKATPLVRRK